MVGDVVDLAAEAIRQAQRMESGDPVRDLGEGFGESPLTGQVEFEGMPERPEPRFPAIDGKIPDRWGFSLGGSTDFPEQDAPGIAEHLTHGRRVLVQVYVLDEDGELTADDPIEFEGRVADVAHPTKKGKRIGRTTVRMVKIKLGAE